MQTIYLIDDEQNLKQELTDYFAEEKLYKFKQIKKGKYRCCIKGHTSTNNNK